jgi:hypothetical protein
MTVYVAGQSPEYSSASQTVSELSAIGAPARSLWMWLGGLYTVLVTAFGWGVLQSAGRRAALRAVGGAILVYGGLGLIWPLAPMHRRDVLAAGGSTWTDTMHLVLSAVTVLLMLSAIAISRSAFGRRFSLYATITLVVLVVGGGLTFLEAPGVGANRPRRRSASGNA